MLATNLFTKRSARVLDGARDSPIALDDYDSDDLYSLPERPAKIPRRAPGVGSTSLSLSSRPDSFDGRARGSTQSLQHQLHGPHATTGFSGLAGSGWGFNRGSNTNMNMNDSVNTSSHNSHTTHGTNNYISQSSSHLAATSHPPTAEEIDQLLDELNTNAQLESLDIRPLSSASATAPLHLQLPRPRPRPTQLQTPVASVRAALPVVSTGNFIDLTDDDDDVIDLTATTTTTTRFLGPGGGLGYYVGADYGSSYERNGGGYGYAPPPQRQREMAQMGSMQQGNQNQWSQAQPQTQQPPVITIYDGPEFSDLISRGKVQKGAMVSKLGVGDEDMLSAMPKAKQPKMLRSELLPYQLQGLAWMLQKEHPQIPRVNEVEQLWSRLPGGGFLNMATQSMQREAPKFASGFVLADDMGLGKTIQIISLICTDVGDEPELVSVPFVNTKECNAGTLIVAPVSVMSNWTSQIEQHVDPATPLSVFVYHGHTRNTVDLGAYDVVVTSYGTMSSEYDRLAIVPRGLFSRHWRRIVLDEAHTIRNPKTKSALAACALTAGSYCSLTGTPIINSLKDLYSLLKFMKYPVLAEFSTFSYTMMRSKRATPLLQQLVSTLCLRRTKDMKFVDLKLPKFTARVLPVELDPEEREKYNLLEKEAKGILIAYQTRKKKPNGAGDAGAAELYRCLLEILLRMRQCVNSTELVRERLEALKKLAGVEEVNTENGEQKKALQELLVLAVESGEECGICLEPLLGHDPRITRCKHCFGRECLEMALGVMVQCPVCRRDMEKGEKSVVGLPEEGAASPAESVDSPQIKAAEDDKSPNPQETKPNIKPEQAPDLINPVHHDQTSLPAPSSKIRTLLHLLLSTASSSPSRKTILFSQWPTFLTLLAPHLISHSIPFTRIDGTLPPSSRDSSIQLFRTSPTCNVLLASLTVCSVGLNLTMASQVVLCDSWWAGAVEQQAVDRVYRIGQKEGVDVWRLVVGGSVEERVLEVQERKRGLVGEAFMGERKRRGWEGVGGLLRA